MKEPKREHVCPDCGKRMVNAHAVKVHRLWKHNGPAGTVTPASTPPPPPPRDDDKPKKKEPDWWL